MIKLIYNFLLALGTGFFVSYDIIYFEHYGLGLAIIALVSSMYDLSSAISDIPLSIFFDRVSPRFVLLVGNAMRIIGFLIFFIDPTNIALVALGQILAGIGGASESGAVDALVINERLSRGESARSVLAILLRLNAVATVVGAGLGYFIFSWDPRFIWIAAATTYVISTLLLFIMGIDPPQKMEASNGVSNLWSSLITSGRLLVRRQEAWLILLGNAAALGAFFTWQSKFFNINDSPNMVFIALVVMKIGIFVSSFFVGKIDLKEYGLIVVLIFNCTGLAALAISNSPFLLVGGFLTHVTCQSILIQVLGAALHETLPNDLRATAFSVLACFDSAAVIVVAPLVGIAAEHISLGSGIAVSGILYIPILLVLTWKIRNTNSMDTSNLIKSD